ncbi:ectomycorrhiza-regulated protein [Mycena leptocephala]|nr:ectomycorrhiza-regulated protein [Mycena leptocephala]
MAGPQRTHPSIAFRKRDPHDGTVPISDTHMQPRTYTTPSRTSRKEIGVPAFFGRRSSSQPSEEEEDELNEEEDGLSEEPLAPNATHEEQFRYKRRQNRLAARHSRKRKLKHQQELEDAVERLTREEEIWKTRVQTLSNLLQSHGITYSDSHE